MYLELSDSLTSKLQESERKDYLIDRLNELAISSLLH